LKNPESQQQPAVVNSNGRRCERGVVVQDGVTYAAIVEVDSLDLRAYLGRLDRRFALKHKQRKAG
jgi:hypothetical protein